MMGTRQKLASLEADVVYGRGTYCYLANNTKLIKFAKRQMSKRRRKDNPEIRMYYINGE